MSKHLLRNHLEYYIHTKRTTITLNLIHILASIIYTNHTSFAFDHFLIGFVDLSQDDQLILIKVGFFELWLCYVSRLATDLSLTFYDGTFITRQQLELIYDVRILFDIIISCKSSVEIAENRLLANTLSQMSPRIRLIIIYTILCVKYCGKNNLDVSQFTIVVVWSRRIYCSFCHWTTCILVLNFKTKY